MDFKIFSILVFTLVIRNIDCALIEEDINMGDLIGTYYDPMTGQSLCSEEEDSTRQPNSSRIAFRGIPCQCSGLTCGCCAGINITSIKLDRRTCTNFTYDPYDFAIKMTVFMNDREIFKNSISAKNPPPLCVPFPYFPAISFCVRFFEVHTPGRNLHACIDFETRAVNQPILILHFNCVKIGADGLAWVRPGDGQSVLGKPEVSEPEVYDEVDFEPQDETLAAVSTSTLSPEEEDDIGQLKLSHLLKKLRSMIFQK